MKQWFVAYTQPHKEDTAFCHLKEQGFNAYLPRFKKMTKHARRLKEVLSPLFPRYLFIEMDLTVQRWRSINGTRGVVNLLTQEGKPAAIASLLIERLKKQEEEKGSAMEQKSFKKGEQVRLLEGAFEGRLATFEELDEKQRVKVLLSFLGKELSVAVPLSAIENI